MRALRIALGFVGAAAAAHGSDAALDRIDEALAVSGLHDSLRARLSGTVDLEGYALRQPAPSLISADGGRLFNPRLTLFLDAQAGSRVYVFAQSRADRGFDPGEGGARMRLDEVAVRLTAGDPWLNLQAGKFATIVGNWVPRHGSWANPFITAPLPYENLTGLWDVEPVRSPAQLLAWAGQRPAPSAGGSFLIKSRDIPVVWGPSYATGAAAFGQAGPLNYAVEVKNAALSSRPGAWGDGGALGRHPALSARIGIAPDPSWSFGCSASEGTYLRQSAGALLAPGRSLGDYRESVFALDAHFAWHYFEAWAEVFAARFRIPGTGDVGSVSGYLEGRLKLTPQASLALRWNQQGFSRVSDARGTSLPWSRPVWRIDVGPAYRFTAHLQLKLQYSVQKEQADVRRVGQLVAAQGTLRF